MKYNETIIAPATGNSVSAIAVIRISGEEAFSATQKVFTPSKDFSSLKSHTLHFGKIKDDDEVIDEVLVSVFKGPKSYTGEDTIEISTHGSPYIQQRVISLYGKLGIRLAEPGEFTMRAFKNGKLDLTQAEAVGDLIASDSKASHEIAMNQMRGGISTKLDALRKELIHFVAMTELELDFSGEDVEFADRSAFKDLLKKLQTHIQPLIDSFAYGNAIKHGVPVAILGKPNAGKSSLLNALLNDDRAIVSDIAGTTRDSIEGVIVLDGIKFRFIDTAGLRDTADTIEAIGVERAMDNAKKSKIILFLYDRSDFSTKELYTILQTLFDKDLHLFLIENKIDLVKDKWEYLTSDSIQTLKQSFATVNSLAISTNSTEDVQHLSKTLSSFVNKWHDDQHAIISQARHLEALKATMTSIEAIENGMDMGIPTDLLAQDMREAIRHLGSITGEIDVDKDILETIFGSFCIGK